MTDAPTNPNVCPTCGGRNTGVTTGFNPEHLPTGEVLLHGTMFRCGDCDQRWAAMGHILLVNRDDAPYTEEGLSALHQAIAQAEPLRIELLEDDEGER